MNNIKLAPINMKKRKQAEQLVYDVFDILDPSGENTKYYRSLFANMSETEFKKFMTKMWEDDTFNFILSIVDFERDIDLASVEKAAKKLNVPLEEYVIMPCENNNLENPIMTPVPVMVMYIIFKRLQQTTRKKNSTSTHISARSATTGQVVGDDKNGRSSDVENSGLVAIGAINVAKEFNGFRADGLQRKNYAYASIATNGTVSLEDVESQVGIADRTVLNTIDVFFLGMGIKTDLVDDSLVLNRTAKEIGRRKK